MSTRLASTGERVQNAGPLRKCAGTGIAPIAQGARYAHSGDGIVEVLDVNFEEEFFVEVGVQSRDVAALSKVIHVIGKDDASLEVFKHPIAAPDAFIVWLKEPLTARPILEVVIDDHGSWRPYPQFQSEG
jgi:hypothetical protein